MSQLPLIEHLHASFTVQKPSKTLKPQIKDGVTLPQAVHDAQRWLNSQDEYTRIEFKYDRNYIVIAKLKDETE